MCKRLCLRKLVLKECLNDVHVHALKDFSELLLYVDWFRVYGVRRNIRFESILQHCFNKFIEYLKT